MAYYDFAWWWRLNEHGCRFVTRLKTHTRLAAVEDRASPDKDRLAGSELLYDRVGFLNNRRASSRTPAGRSGYPHFGLSTGRRNASESEGERSGIGRGTLTRSQARRAWNIHSDGVRGG